MSFLHKMNNHTNTYTILLAIKKLPAWFNKDHNYKQISLQTVDDYQNGCQWLVFWLLFSLLLLLLLSKPFLTDVSDGKLTSPASYLANVPHFIH